MDTESAKTVWPERLAVAALVILAFFGPAASVISRVVLGVMVPVVAVFCLPFVISVRPSLPSRPVCVAILVFLALLWFGVLNTAGPQDRVLHFAFSSAGLLVATLVLLSTVLSLPFRHGSRVLEALEAGVALCGLGMVVEWQCGQPLTGLTATLAGNAVPKLYKLDRAIVIGTLLLWPVIARLWLGGASLWRISAVILGTVVLVVPTSSQASAGALVFGLAAFFVASSFPRLASWGLRLAVYVGLTGAPFLHMIVNRMPGTEFFFFHNANANARIRIWNETVIRIMENPWTGHGIESGFLASTSYLHPHNGPLQVWLEFGLVGAILLALFMGWLVRQMDRAGGRVRPVAQAAFVSWLLIFSVGYDIWQAWWQATAVFLVVMLVLAARLERQAAS